MDSESRLFLLLLSYHVQLKRNVLPPLETVKYVNQLCWTLPSPNLKIGTSSENARRWVRLLMGSIGVRPVWTYLVGAGPGCACVLSGSSGYPEEDLGFMWPGRSRGPSYIRNECTWSTTMWRTCSPAFGFYYTTPLARLTTLKNENPKKNTPQWDKCPTEASIVFK